MVIKILIWSIFVVLIMGFINPYAWYCSELRAMGHFYEILFSECCLINLLSVFVAIVLLDYINVKKHWIIIIALNIVLMKIFVMTLNVGKFDFSILIQHFIGYIGDFIGILLGILYVFWKKEPPLGH